MELSLAEAVPLWRTLRDEGVTALITPALDYVGGLELGTKDVRFESGEVIAQLGESLRNLISSLDDRCSLLFVYRVTDDVEDVIREYESVCASGESSALRVYVAARAEWLRKQRLRRIRVFLFFSLAGVSISALGRGALGGKLVFGNADAIAQERHQAELNCLAQLRDRIVGRFAQMGLTARELSPEDFWQIHYQLLNPTRARQRLVAPEVAVREDIWSEGAFRALGEHVREYSEAEQICHESLEDERGHFRQGDRFRRVMTLKVLPERATDYFASEPLLSLALERGGVREPVPYTLAVAIHVSRQGSARWALNVKHRLVDALRRALPIVGGSATVEQEAADEVHKASIEELFRELHEMYSKIVSLSVSLLLEASSLEVLDAQTEAARTSFNAVGNSELETEDVSQVPAFLSMLPGSGAYQLRKKGCTSRNAGDFLPVFAPWRGCSRAASVLLTPTGDVFKFDLFDKTLGNAFHGLVAADTGSGKSVSLGALTIDALAAGLDAILVDNGGSWRPLTELMGGVYIPVNLRTSICPFPSYEGVVDPANGELDKDEIASIVNFIDLCVTDQGRSGFDIVTTDVVARAIQGVYEGRLRSYPTERPLVGLFAEALKMYGETAQDKAIAQDVARRLGIYCDGLYADFLNRESELRFDSRLLTFDMAEVSQNATAKKLAMATIMRAIGNRAAARRNRTLVEVDEGHEYLGTDAVAERFLAGCYRKMRKYDVAMWMISQNLADFVNSPVGEPIINNALIKIFLRHGKGAGREGVIKYFKLSPRAARAFGELERRSGYHSDFFLIYGERATTVRLALHPLAYWILTTDPADRELIERAAEKNPHLKRLELLEGLAERYPHGAANGGPRRSASPEGHRVPTS